MLNARASYVIAFGAFMLTASFAHATSSNDPTLAFLTTPRPPILDPVTGQTAKAVSSITPSAIRALGFTCSANNFECPGNSMDARQLLTCSVSDASTLLCGYGYGGSMDGVNPCAVVKSTIKGTPAEGVGNRVECEYDPVSALPLFRVVGVVGRVLCALPC